MDNIEELLKLIKENPNLEIIPMVDAEIVADDDSRRWLGSIGSSRVDNFLWVDDMTYTDIDELVDDFIQANFEDEPYKNMNDEEFEKIATEKVKAMDWKKAIIVNIDLP